MIQCNKIVTELLAYHKGEVNHEMKILIENHLNTCAFCRKELNSLIQLDNLLSSYKVEPVSEDFSVKFQNKMSRMEMTEEKPHRLFVFNWRRVGLLASAALVTIALVTWLITPFNITSANGDTEIINTLDLMENMETVQIIESIEDYEVLVALPEIMDVDLKGE
ncbi:MAG: hypothetical protein QME51_00140 [Planctomycetota bacterium]|nr:hypothetical protein [Planctomycetota bacterium]MDI6786768.1 hypothetical protein [Planctomycetota bacterium]